MKIDLPADLERELVSTALSFRAAKPWRGLANSDYLLVDEPSHGLRALAILGYGGEQFGLHAYAASCATEWLFRLDDTHAFGWPDPAAMLEILEGESLELEGKAATDARDRARLARAGYRPAPRARQAWPVFRQLRPGHIPWHIEEAPARRLLADLRRAMRWAELAPSLGIDGRVHTPVALRRLPAVSAELTTERAWTEADIRWIQLQLPSVRRPEPLLPSASDVAEMRTVPRRPTEWWWVDERPQLAPIAERDDEPPYFPRLGLCLDGRADFAHPPAIAPANKSIGRAALEALRGAMRATGYLPGELRMTDESLAIALGPWSEAAGVPIRLENGSDVLDEFWGMLEEFGRR